jgi:hypothetical protein
MAKSIELPSADRVETRLNTVYSLPEKVRSNTDAGLAAYQTANVPHWPGYKKELFGRKITFLAEFDETSAAQIRTRIQQPLTEIASYHGINLLTSLPGDLPPYFDLPPHFTVQFPHFVPGTELATIQEVTTAVTTQTSTAAENLEGAVVPIDTLVLAGPQLYICAGRPTRSRQAFANFWKILDTRDKINAVLDPVPILENPSYDDIIHSVAGRVIGTNNPNYSAFEVEANATVRHNLTKDPIDAVVGRVYVGPITDYIDAVNPQLLV